jgi:tetratricopeptide (TPR) repeat protein
MNLSDAVRLSRAVRLFISSTFSDMQAERRVLVERVFPRVRDWCQSRGVSFTEIDLRWGITEEQSRAGRVLPICLEEIDACHPFFLGLLGGRYGTSVESFSSEVLIDYPWLGGLEQCSYTELEFIRAISNKRSEEMVALIYERDSSVDIEPEPAGSERARRLVEFKAKIRNAGLLRRQERYRSAEELGEWVLADFTSALSQLFPEQTPPSPIERERNTQKLIRRLRGRRFIGRPTLLKRLNAHVTGNGRPLLITAPPGGGKSALLATWTTLATGEFLPSLYLGQSFSDRVARLLNADPVRATKSLSSQVAKIVSCAVAASPQTSSWEGIANFICEEFSQPLPFPTSVRDAGQKRMFRFADCLATAAAKGRVVLVLDGLDQLGDEEADRAIASFPGVLPENLRVIISTSEGRTAQRLRSSGFVEVRLPQWSEPERQSYIRAFHDDYGKQLSTSLEQQLIHAPQTGLPLFLQTSLEELRVGANRKELPATISRHLGAKDVAELFEQMFARFETSYDNERAHLVRGTLSFLWAARRGLRESELRNLLGDQIEPLNARIWAPLVTALRPHLLQREGLLAVDRQSMLDAVKQRYLSSRQDRLRINGVLADYFQMRLPESRSVEELPWQLFWAARIDDLLTLLANPGFLPLAWNHDSEEILRLIGMLETGGVRLSKIFSENIATLGSNLGTAAAAASLLFALGEMNVAAVLAGTAVQLAETGGEKTMEQRFSMMLALIEHRAGNLVAAERRLAELIRRSRNEGRIADLAVQIGNRGVLLREMGRTEEAHACFLEEKILYNKGSNASGESAAVGHLAQIDFDRGHIADALKGFNDQMRRCRQTGDLQQLQSALGNAAACYAREGRLEEALSLHREEEELCRMRGDRHALQVCLGNQARLLQRFYAPDYDRAMTLLEERETLAKELGDPAAEAATLLQFSRLYYALNRSGFRDAAVEYAGNAAALAGKHGLAHLNREIEKWRETLGAK